MQYGYFVALFFDLFTRRQGLLEFEIADCDITADVIPSYRNSQEDH